MADRASAVPRQQLEDLAWKWNHRAETHEALRLDHPDPAMMNQHIGWRDAAKEIASDLEQLVALLAADPVQGAPPTPDEKRTAAIALLASWIDEDSTASDDANWQELRAALALPSRVVPPDSGTVADVRAALGASLSNELAEAVLESRVVPPAPPKSQALRDAEQLQASTLERLNRETRSPDGDGQDAFAGGVDRGRAICSPQPLRPAGSEPAESHTTTDLDRLVYHARTNAEATTRSINDLGAAIERARETQPPALTPEGLEAFIATRNYKREHGAVCHVDTAKPPHGTRSEFAEGYAYAMAEVFDLLEGRLHFAAAGASPHAPQPPKVEKLARAFAMEFVTHDHPPHIAPTLRNRQSRQDVESARIDQLFVVMLAFYAAAHQAWQPIETAPKDGHALLTMVAGKVPFVAWWVTGDQFGGFWRGDARYRVYPTHWMPPP